MRRLHEFARAESRIAIARSHVLFPRGHHVGHALAFYADAVQGLLTREEAGTTGSVTVQGAAYETVDLAARLALSSDKDGPDTRHRAVLSWRASGEHLGPSGAWADGTRTISGVGA